jgi:hypothetical protein
MTFSEAFFCALPVIASRLGDMETMIEDQRTKRLFKAGCDESLTEVIA